MKKSDCGSEEKGEKPRELPSIGDEVLVGDHYKARNLKGETWVMLGEYKYKMGSADAEKEQILLGCVPEQFGGIGAFVQQIKDGRFGKIERAEDYVKIKRAIVDEFRGVYIGCDSHQEFFDMQDRAKGEMERQANDLEAVLARIRGKLGQ
ncbi:MAG: hypothetical protein WC846_02485 [Candidatus Gracilibacteria bacterium]|jgi:hypothetical protein